MPPCARIIVGAVTTSSSSMTRGFVNEMYAFSLRRTPMEDAADRVSSATFITPHNPGIVGPGMLLPV